MPHSVFVKHIYYTSNRSSSTTLRLVHSWAELENRRQPSREGEDERLKWSRNGPEMVIGIPNDDYFESREQFEQ